MQLECVGELESTAQVKDVLQRTLSASSSLEMRLGQAETEQAQMHSATEEAKVASKRAIAQATRLCEEQERTSQQVAELLTTQADDTQKCIQGATRVALQTQQEVQPLSALARTADLTAKMATEKAERQFTEVQ